MTQMQKTLNAKTLTTPLSAPARPSFFNRQMLWVVLFFGLLVWALF